VAAAPEVLEVADPVGTGAGDYAEGNALIEDGFQGEQDAVGVSMGELRVSGGT